MSETMSGKERILCALNNGQPDRVPVFEMGFNEASIVNLGKHFTDDVPPIQHIYDMPPEQQPRYLEVLALILKELGNDGISTVFITKKERLDEHRVVDKYGTISLLSEEGEPIPVEGPIQSPQDLAKVADMAPDPLDYMMLAYMVSTMGKDVAHFFTIPDPFRFSWQLRGAMEKLLLDYMRAPDFALELGRITNEFCKAALEMAADTGADVVALEGDLAFNTNTLMSPDHYRYFVKPFHAQIVQTAHARGMKIIKHSDGNLWPILDDLLEVGFDGIHPIQPQSMDIGEVKRHLQGKAAVVGNIDCSFLLPFGTEQEVDQTVRQTIATAAPGGGYIISSSNSIHPGVKPKNYIAMVKAARKYGAYPIDL